MAQSGPERDRSRPAGVPAGSEGVDGPDRPRPVSIPAPGGAIANDAPRFEKEWALTFDAVPDLVAIIDVRCRILRMNSAMSERLGITREEAVGRTCHRLLHGTEEPPPYCPHAHALADGCRHVAEVFEKRLGGYFLVSVTPILDDRGFHVASVHVARDISARKRAEASLRRSEERYRHLFDNMYDVFYRTDMEGRLIHVSPSAVRATGYGTEELLGTNMRDHYAVPEDRDRLVELLLRDGSVEGFESRMRRKDGRIVWASTNARLIVDEDGLPVGVEGISRDVTNTKLLQDELVRSERLAATGRFAASVAHEINSPLQAITVLLGSLKRRFGTEERLSPELDLLKEGIDRIRDTVKNLLDLNRPGGQHRQPTNLNQIVRNTVGLVQNHLRIRGIRVRLDLSPDLPDLLASPHQLDTVLLNLINNAEEALSGASERETAVPENGGGPREITIRTFAQEEEIVLQVSDNGPGIPEEDLPHVFDAFYTRKKAAGVGLGLSLCRDAVRGLNGTIEAGEAPEGGARFTLRLPIR